MQTILITGASGNVGSWMRRLLAPHYPELRLTDLHPPSDLRPGEHFLPAELASFDEVMAVMDGVDGVVHLGGHSVEGSWSTILDANIRGTYHIFEAARRQGVGRLVFASSNHAVGFYPRRRRIGVNARTRPDSRYGVSKVFGEALASLYADKYGLRVLSIRIGNVAERPCDRRRLSIWIHPEDLAQLVRIGLEHPDLRNEIVFGVSDNERSWWDNDAAWRLGYRPRHRAEDHAAEALAREALLEPDPIADYFEGGSFCSQEFEGGLDDFERRD